MEDANAGAKEQPKVGIGRIELPTKCIVVFVGVVIGGVVVVVVGADVTPAIGKLGINCDHEQQRGVLPYKCLRWCW